MKVAMIGLRGFEESLGGVEKAVREIAVRLSGRGGDVTCFCRPRYNTLEEFQGVKLVNTPTLYSKHAETAFYALGAVISAARGDYDIIHIHALASSSLIWLSRILSPKKRIVVTIHGLDWQRAKWGPAARAMLKFGEFCAANLADSVICVSQSLKDYYTARYPGRPVEYIPNGCDSLCGDLPREVQGYPSGSYLLYMGRLTPEKGVHRLIKAYRSVCSDKKLLIAGPSLHSKKYEIHLRQLTEKDNRIEFIGPIRGQQKEGILSNAYAFVLPSELEGLSITLLEAACRSIPCVVSDIPMNTEILGPSGVDNGYIFKTYDTRSLGEAIQICIDYPDHARLKAENLKSWVTQNYNWDTAAQQTLALYEQVLSAGGNK